MTAKPLHTFLEGTRVVLDAPESPMHGETVTIKDRTRVAAPMFVLDSTGRTAIVSRHWKGVAK